MIQDIVLHFVMGLLQNPALALPQFMIILATWRVAKLRNMTQANYQDKVTESVADTIKEQMSYNLIEPLFQENNIKLPRGTTAGDVIERMVEHDPTNLEILSQIYTSLQDLGTNSEFYGQALQIVSTGGG